MYKVVGADRREYGPVTRETILEWIAQRRANSQTIAKFEDGAWKPLGTFDEFKDALGVIPPDSPDASFSQPQVIYTGAEPPPFSGVGSQAKTNVASVIGLVAPLVCCCCCYVGPSIGILFSAIGWSQIRSNPTRYSTSDALPKIGLVLSILMLILHIVYGVFKVQIQRSVGPTPQFPFNF